MSPPRPLSDTELHALEQGALFAHLVACRDAGMVEQATRATWFLLAKGIDDIKAKLALKLPRDVAEAKVSLVIERMVGQPFRGTSTGEFFSLRNTIIGGVIADFFRGPEGRQHDADKEGARLARDEDDSAPAPAVDDPGFEHVEKYEIIERVLASRSEAHRQVIQLFVIEDLPAKDVAERTGVGIDNISQIKKRFITDCLDAAADS